MVLPRPSPGTTVPHTAKRLPRLGFDRLEIACGERLPDPRRRERLGLPHQGHGIDHEAPCRTEGVEQLEIPGLPVPEAESRADGNQARIEAAHEHLVDERLRGLTAQSLIEVEQRHLVHAQRRKELEAAAPKS